ncbi:hypothetical protein SAMN05444920_1393 [Nonomuraea solani]|uniref:SH3 domain-containing protein n=1 Tax=Nonomuraea solani TaxID=1144553 RepID=A0A1H6F3L2_9ACTN|nr:hypothetical protein [Nonomuraea solani]SEH03544.1 hypothetical protein SAMN05444920_1393 [Nonomuraea solani]
MLTIRITASLAAAALASGVLVALGGASPAGAVTVLERPGCRYQVQHVITRLNVRIAPRGRIVDKLYPGDRTWGSCKKLGKWRRIHGTEVGRRGFAFAAYLKKIGRR